MTSFGKDRLPTGACWMSISSVWCKVPFTVAVRQRSCLREWFLTLRTSSATFKHGSDAAIEASTAQSNSCIALR